MQEVKDSFYMALRERLAEVNPARTIGEAARPAVLVCENESEEWLLTPEAFYLRWLGQSALPADAAAAGWYGLHCEIGYRTTGSELSSRQDRGRTLAALDVELRAMLQPGSTQLKDYSSNPEQALDSVILWTAPVFQEPKDEVNGLQRIVGVEILGREDA
jgi:hypothetical protein